MPKSGEQSAIDCEVNRRVDQAERILNKYQRMISSEQMSRQDKLRLLDSFNQVEHFNLRNRLCELIFTYMDVIDSLLENGKERNISNRIN